MLRTRAIIVSPCEALEALRLRIKVTVSANSGQVAIRIQDMAGGHSAAKVEAILCCWKMMNMRAKHMEVFFSSD